MSALTVAAIAILILFAALLYSSVGHAGASGYLAVMALFGMAPDAMKPTALVLNILVATIATAKFYRAGCFSWPILWPLILLSIPCSFIGGAITLQAAIYKPVVGAILLYAAFRLIRLAAPDGGTTIEPFPLWAALISGAVVGLLSGLTGTGGGIFISPLLLFKRWAETKQASGVSAAFILVNSIAGLSGHLSSVATLPEAIPYWASAAVAGGWMGAEYGSRRLAGANLRRVLALLLIVAGLKLIFA